jgi:beta-glucosidase
LISQFVPPVAAVPGLIEAENFDVGGQGIGYYNIYKGEPNTAINNDIRKDAELTVDVLDKKIPDSGEYVIGWTEKGMLRLYRIISLNSYSTAYCQLHS